MTKETCKLFNQAINMHRSPKCIQINEIEIAKKEDISTIFTQSSKILDRFIDNHSILNEYQYIHQLLMLYII